MQSTREKDSKKDNDQSGLSISAWLFNQASFLIRYSITHPFQTLFFIFLGSTMDRLRSFWQSDDVIKYPIDSLHLAYTGPSFLYFPDKNFNPTRDLIGWTTDRHPAGYLVDKDKWKWEFVNSYYLDDLPEKENKKLAKERYFFYQWCFFNSNFEGYGNILSHRSQNPNGQSAFGLFGFPTLEDLTNYYNDGKGFIVGIRAFGNENYYSTVNNITYQLAKIDLRTIDLDQINPIEHNSLASKIAHVYLKNDEVQQHPNTDALKNNFCKEGWSLDCYESYIKNLPNFSDMVDWVIRSADLSSALRGEAVENMLDHKKVNIREWQKKQKEKARQPLEKYSIFTLPRPGDYDYSYKFDEVRRKLEQKPRLRFKIGTH